MLKVDGSLDHIPARRAHVVSLLESINQPLVNIPGYGAAPTGAFTLGTKNDHGAFTVFVYLFQPQTQAVLIYVSEPRALTSEQLVQEEAEAVRFVESMGFMMDDVRFGQLSVADQDAVMERVPMFRPLSAPVVTGRPTSEPRFGALGGVVAGRPEGNAESPRPRTGEGSFPGRAMPVGVAGFNEGVGDAPHPHASSGVPHPATLPISAAAPLLPQSEPPAAPPPPPVSGTARPVAGSQRGFGRGLPQPSTVDESRRPPGAAQTANLSRIGRLLGTFCLPLCLLVGSSTAGCAATSNVNTRARDATLDLGTQELARQRWVEALRHFQAVLAQEDDDADANRGAGLAYWRLERFDLAENHLRKAIEKRKDWSEPKNELAVILTERNSCDAAIELLAEVLEDVFYPTRHFAEHNLARAEACAGQPGEAVRRLARLTSKRPKFCLAYLTASEVASSAQLHEETVEACESFREYCERDEEIGQRIPESLKATCDLRKGRAYVALGDVESARTALGRCSGSENTRMACREALELLPP